MDLRGVHGLIVGGGKVAARKIERLVPYGAELTVIAPVVSDACKHIGVHVWERNFRDEDITNEFGFVIAAVGDTELNRRVCDICKAKNIPVDSSCDPGIGSFVFPAVIQKGKLSVGICTSGASPTASAWTRDRFEEVLPDRFDEILEFLNQKRREALLTIQDHHVRSAYLRKLFYASIEADRPLTDEECRRLIES